MSRSAIFQRRSARSANDLSHGARNGRRTGTRCAIARTGAARSGISMSAQAPIDRFAGRRARHRYQGRLVGESNHGEILRGSRRQGRRGMGCHRSGSPRMHIRRKVDVDLFSMSMEAVRLWADSALSAGPLPKPRDVDALLQDQEVRATIEAIGPVSFIEVPLLRDAGRAVRTNERLDRRRTARSDRCRRQTARRHPICVFSKRRAGKDRRRSLTFSTQPQPAHAAEVHRLPYENVGH